jgi:hypothetical protein
LQSWRPVRRVAELGSLGHFERMFRFLTIIIAAAMLTACQTHRADVDLRGKVTDCALHHTRLHSARVPLGIGCSLPRDGYLEARDQSFPHSYPRWAESRRDYCIVSVCDSCIQSEHEWAQKQ